MRSAPAVSVRISNVGPRAKLKATTQPVMKGGTTPLLHSGARKTLARPKKVYQAITPARPSLRQPSAVVRSVSTIPSLRRGGFGVSGVPCPPSTRSSRGSVVRSGVSSSSGGSFSNSAPSPLTVYYVERQIKSIRVSTVPDIDRWEGALRENMALKGRNRTKVKELLGRIRNHYQNDNIQATDYSPDGKGFAPSEYTRKLAEDRIIRTVESMADFYEKSGNPEMDSSKSASGDSFLKGKLTFVNTELDKMGKPRITLNELKETITLKINGSFPQPEASEDPANLTEQIAKEVPILDEKVIKQRVKAHYLGFADWLASKEKAFPSPDPEVDEMTMKTFDLVNAELRGIGKFESMHIFREKTIAYLEDILDGEIVPEAGPLFADRILPGLPVEAKDRLEVETRPELFFRPVQKAIPFNSKPSGLPLLSTPALPGDPFQASPPTKLEGVLGGSFSPASERPLPGKSWTPVRKNVPTNAPLEIRKLGSLPGIPI